MTVSTMKLLLLDQGQVGAPKTWATQITFLRFRQSRPTLIIILSHGSSVRYDQAPADSRVFWFKKQSCLRRSKEILRMHWFCSPLTCLPALRFVYNGFRWILLFNLVDCSVIPWILDSFLRLLTIAQRDFSQKEECGAHGYGLSLSILRFPRLMRWRYTGEMFPPLCR